MSQPLIYVFYGIVGILILFFGIRAIVGLQDTGEKVEFRTFVSEIEGKIEKVYHDSYGSTVSLDKIVVPNFITEVCFIGEYQEDEVSDVKLKQVMEISEADYNNVYFAHVEPSKWEREKMERLAIEGTVCDSTRDGKINIVLLNDGNAGIKVR